MKLAHFPLAFLLGISGMFILGGCGEKDDTGETTETETDADADADSDTDTDTTPDYFEPYAFFLSWSVGIVDGSVGTVTYSGHEIPSQLDFQVCEEKYFDSYDDRYACTVTVYISDLPQSANVSAESWALWDLPMDAVETDCDDFDPAVYGTTDAAEILANGSAWSFGPGPFADDGTLEDMYANHFDWENTFADYVWSSHFYWDVEGGGDLGSGGLGIAYEVDGTGAIVESPVENEYYGTLTPIESLIVKNMPDGLYTYSPLYGWDGSFFGYQAI